MIGRLLSFPTGWRWSDQTPIAALRLLIIGGTLLIIARLARSGSQDMFMLILFLLGGLVAVLVFMRWPPLGLIVLTLGGMTIPFKGPAGINVTMMLVVLLSILWLTDMVIVRRDMHLAASGMVRPLLLLAFIACVSFLAGQIHWFHFARNAPLDAQLAGFVIFILSIAAFFLAANQIRSLKWLQAMVWIFLALSALFILARGVPGMKPLIALFQSGAIGGIFYAWLAPMALSQALFNRDLHRFWRLALVALVIASIHVGFVQFYGWKSGWVPPFVGIAAVLVFHSWRTGLLVTIVGALPGWLLFLDAMATDDYSLSTRLDAWRIMGEIIKVNPIWGLGFANYYWYTPLFAIRGWTVEFNSHNNYVDIVAQTGLVGLFGIIWFFWAAAKAAWRLRERVPPGFARAYVYGAFGGLAGTATAAMLGDWLLPFVYNIGMNGMRTGILAWLFLGGLVVLEQLYPEPSVKGDVNRET